MHKVVTGRVEAKKLLSHRRQSNYTILGIHYHGAYVEICLLGTSRQLHGYYMGRH